ncbi:MAG: YihY/virulence factor BrkB family protein [Acidobacteriia bacterium]|nr:YihY/virulence factor BrkB family protein [Terriglobia bacterium]
MLSGPRTFGFLLRRSLVAAFDDGCLGIAKGAAYSALLSFFPVLTSAAAILVQTRAQFVSNAIENSLSEIVPPGSETLVMEQFRVAGARPMTLLVIAGLVSLWAASGVIKSLIEGFHAAYRVPRNRGFLSQSGLAMSLVLLCAVPLLCASVLIVFGGQVESAVLHWLKVDQASRSLASLWSWVSRIMRYAVAFGAVAAVAACLYYLGPRRRQRWRYVWPGSALATVLWLLATSVFGWYVRHVAHYNVMYGSIGAGIALLVWMYLLAVIALIGCEFNAACERAAA